MRNKLLFILVLASEIALAQKKDLELWYNKPAAAWTDALPIGNGRLGAMIYGDYLHENIQLNEESVWAGSKINNNNPEAKTYLPVIRQAIFNGEYKKANDLSVKYLVGIPAKVRSYQPLGNLFIHYDWKGSPNKYRRTLNINSGINKTEYTIDGNRVIQEVFSSAPNDIIVVRISAEKQFNASFRLSREFNVVNESEDKRKKQKPTVSLAENNYKSASNQASIIGQIVDIESAGQGPGGKHMRYACVMKIQSINGIAAPVTTDTTAGFDVSNTKNIVLLITGATDYDINKLDLNPAINPLKICNRILKNASQKRYVDLKKTHELEHRSFFERVNFSLGDDINEYLPTDERLAKMKQGNLDNGLIALYYQYGRYLLMGSSRKPGRLPANLQGIWNNLYDAPWNADFHTNINLQMNYWPAETGNLSETSLVLSNFLEKLMVPGSETAREMYGAKGWTMHHLTDLFGKTGVMDGVWGLTAMDGPWMTFSAFDHYEFTKDVNYLKTVAYPLTKGAVEFVLDYLVKSPEGYLVTNPSHSPENTFCVPGTDKKGKAQMTYAPTMDTHIINGLFNNFIIASTVLNIDDELTERVKAAQKQLPPLKIATNGTIQEWIDDYEEVDPGHRHISHLLGLYPLNLITPKDTVFFEAAKKTLARRLSNGGGHTGWSKAWIVSLYARLLEPEKALENIQGLFIKSTHNNLFDTHPPFQIDGNFGCTAGIAEMLLQSQNGEINLLPALPAVWTTGSLHGIRARGACTISMDWKNNNLINVSVKSDKGGDFVLRYKEKIKKVTLKAGESITMKGELIN
jgi:alpha-L-fucosidase 2